MAVPVILDWHCAANAEVPHVAVEDVTDPDAPVRVADFYPNGCSMETCEDRALKYIDLMVTAGLATSPEVT